MTDRTDVPMEDTTIAADSAANSDRLPQPDLTAVILSGGASRRMGRDKASLELDGIPLLERTATAARAAGASRIVVVGDPLDETSSPAAASPLTGARFVREDPPRSGPVPALDAALAAVGTDWLLLLPCDLARPADACRALVAAFRRQHAATRDTAAAPATPGVPQAPAASGDPGAPGAGRDGVVAVDATGHRQHLSALLSVDALRASARPGITRVRDRMAALDVAEVPEPAHSPGLWDDMDTPEDVTRMRAGRGAGVSDEQVDGIPGLREWMSAVVTELDLPEDVIVPAPLLDTARDVANGVLRPGAPMSTYLIGVALGLQLARAKVTTGDDRPDGGTADDAGARADAGAGADTEWRIRDLAARVQDLVTRYDAGPAGER